jgi:hypothetical protein
MSANQLALLLLLALRGAALFWVWRSRRSKAASGSLSDYQLLSAGADTGRPHAHLC